MDRATAKEQMATRLANLTLAELCDCFEATEKRTDEGVELVREVLMDEFESRDGTAFIGWLDSIELSPRSFFLTV